MAIRYSNFPTQKPIFSVYSVILVTLLVLIARNVNSAETTKFNFDRFNEHGEITLQGYAKILANGVLELTNNSNPNSNKGHALYSEPIHIWDSATGNVASFHTSFSFVMDHLSICNISADGIIFFLAPPDIKIPENSYDGNLAIVDGKNAVNRYIGVEFDIFQNSWDPIYSHIGINANSMISLNHVKWNWVSGSLYKINIVYDSLFKTLSVYVTDQFGEISTIDQIIDLKDVLPEKIKIGFSASTSSVPYCQKHDIYSWSFKSTLEASSSIFNSTKTIKNNIATYA